MRDQGSWRYSNGILYQTDSLGLLSKGSIKWISDNEAIFTIIDNGNPIFTGEKVRYFRQ